MQRRSRQGDIDREEGDKLSLLLLWLLLLCDCDDGTLCEEDDLGCGSV